MLDFTDFEMAMRNVREEGAQKFWEKRIEDPELIKAFIDGCVATVPGTDRPSLTVGLALGCLVGEVNKERELGMLG